MQSCIYFYCVLLTTVALNEATATLVWWCGLSEFLKVAGSSRGECLALAFYIPSPILAKMVWVTFANTMHSWTVSHEQTYTPAHPPRHPLTHPPTNHPSAHPPEHNCMMLTLHRNSASSTILTVCIAGRDKHPFSLDSDGFLWVFQFWQNLLTFAFFFSTWFRQIPYFGSKYPRNQTSCQLFVIFGTCIILESGCSLNLIPNYQNMVVWWYILPKKDVIFLPSRRGLSLGRSQRDLQ